jgi:circadian clock protein KaiC
VNERLPSGEENLDAIFGGGLPVNSICLLLGPPGVGKSLLAEQYAFRNATLERPAVYLTTVSEPYEKLIRYGQDFMFFDTAAVGRSVFFEDLAGALMESGLEGALERLVDILRERRPGLLVIDSFKALHAFASDAGHLRRFVHELAGRLSAFPASVFWVGEYDESAVTEAPEFAVADAIVTLSRTHVGERQVRLIEVLKLRGSDFLSGRHAYRISAEGVQAFPRLADQPPTAAYSLERRRLSSGVPALDEMLEGGVLAGSSTLVIGPSGCGKTLTGLHFIFEGARSGEQGLIAGFQEDPTQLERIAQGFGWTLAQDGVDVMYRSPVDLLIDEWVYEVIEAMKRTGIRRLLIDSIGELRMGSPDEVRFREYLYSLLKRCAGKDIGVLMTMEASPIRDSAVSPPDISHLSDNILLLEYLHRDGRVERTMTILKTRASGHRTDVRPFEIGSRGIVLDRDRGGPDDFPNRSGRARPRRRA